MLDVPSKSTSRLATSRWPTSCADPTCRQGVEGSNMSTLVHPTSHHANPPVLIDGSVIRVTPRESRRV